MVKVSKKNAKTDKKEDTEKDIIEQEIEDRVSEMESDEVPDFLRPIADPKTISWLDTGSTPMNLACSQLGINGGIPRGRITNPVGDGSAGKTIFALEICARAFYKLKKSIHFPKTKKMEIVYNNNEAVMDFDIDMMFGNKNAKNDSEDFVKSCIWQGLPTIEKIAHDFFNRVQTLKEDTGLIYVIDSWDAVKSDTEMKSFEAEAKADGPNKKPSKKKESDQDEKKKGSFHLDKAAYASKTFFKQVCELMNGRDVTLIILSQTRVKIGTTFKEVYRTGEGSLNFYTHLVPWLSVYDKLDKTVDGQKFLRAIQTRAKIKRSKVSKAFREADTIITMDYGVDNIGSCINYLIGYKESYPVETVAKELRIKRSLLSEKTVTRIRLTQIIEDNDLEDHLSRVVEDVWLTREEKVNEPRKSKF